ncbi:MAG TPA: hypothetical protein VN854_00025 [Mycoplasmatales bacterium]|jgi:hypothetical protein|nr:hypothetical protein [Mycoplasmatales bacterium]
METERETNSDKLGRLIPIKERGLHQNLFVFITVSGDEVVSFTEFPNLKKLPILADKSLKKVILDKESLQNLEYFCLRFSLIENLESILNSISNAEKLKHIDLRDNNIRISIDQLNNLIKSFKSRGSFKELEILDISNENKDRYHNIENHTNCISDLNDEEEILIDGIKVIVANCNGKVNMPDPLDGILRNLDNLNLRLGSLNKSPLLSEDLKDDQSLNLEILNDYYKLINNRFFYFLFIIISLFIIIPLILLKWQNKKNVKHA